MKHKYVYLLMLLLLVANACAEEETLGDVKQSSCITLPQSSNATLCIIQSIQYPNKTIELTGYDMVQNGSYWYYTPFCKTKDVGEYIVNTECDNTIYPYSFRVTLNDIPSNDTAGQIRFGIGISVSLMVIFIVFRFISRFFGSMMVLLLGMGILRADTSNGWIGWIVMACGLIMLIYTLIEPPRRSR